MIIMLFPFKGDNENLISPFLILSTSTDTNNHCATICIFFYNIVILKTVFIFTILDVLS